MDPTTTTWLLSIYKISFLINTIFVLIICYFVVKERKDGPAKRGSFAYWYITQIASMGSKEIWTHDKLHSNMWMYTDQGVEIENGDRVCTLRHEKPKILFAAIPIIACPIYNVVMTISLFCKIIASTVEDGIDSDRLVDYPYNHYHDRVPPKSKDDYDDIDRGW